MHNMSLLDRSEFLNNCSSSILPHWQGQTLQIKTVTRIHIPISQIFANNKICLKYYGLVVHLEKIFGYLINCGDLFNPQYG